MSDTEYTDIENAILGYFQSDAWLGDTDNIKLSHRLPLAYLPNYRADQVPAVSFSIEGEKPDLYTANQTIDRGFVGLFRVTCSGVGLEALSIATQGIIERVRERFSDYGIVGTPINGIGMINSIDVESAETGLPEMFERQFFLTTTARVTAWVVQQSLAPSGADPIPEDQNAYADVLTAVAYILAQDSTISALVSDVSVGPRVEATPQAAARYPRITLLPWNLGPMQKDTVTDFLTEFPFIAMAEQRGHSLMFPGGVTDTEDTLKRLTAAILRRLRAENMKSPPMGGLCNEVRIQGWHIERGAETMEQDPLMMRTILTAAAVLTE